MHSYYNPPRAYELVLQGERNSWRMQFKNTRLFFSRAGMTHYPGSKAGSLVSWVVPQYSDTQIAPAHRLQRCAPSGTVTTAAKHTCTWTQLHMNKHAHLCWNPGKVMCANLREIFFLFGFLGGRVKSQVTATHRRVYPSSSRVQEQGDSPTRLLLRQCRATVKTCHYWIFTAVLSDGCSATSWCETSPRTSQGLLLSRWMQPEEVWGGCWKG